MNTPTLSLRYRVLRHLAVIFALSAALLPPGLLAEEKNRMVEVQGQFFHATAAQLDEALKAAQVSSAGAVLNAEQFAAVRAKLKENGAEIFSEPRVLTSSGTRAAAQSIREVRYPTEYEASKRDAAKSVPTAFETRNVGVTLDVEPVASPNGLAIDLTVSPQVTRFLGFIDYSSEKPPTSKADTRSLEDLLKAPLGAGGIWQPVFATFTINTSLKLKNGETAILAGTVGAEIPGRKTGGESPKRTNPAEEVVVFLTARAISGN
jgi:type II secretory pathway component GspD/PulD (secretin)